MLYAYFESNRELERARASKREPESEWHFFPTDETRFYLTEASKTVKRLQSEKSRLSFMDK